MAFALISVILLIILILIAIKTGLNRGHTTDEPTSQPVIHASGIYSIVKKSPRENVHSKKPSREDIGKYLSGQNVDSEGAAITEEEKQLLIEQWESGIEDSIKTIEKGDVEGIEFYYYEFLPVDCPVCHNHVSRGKFVTREEIFRYPDIIPPLHLGCTCKLLPHHGKEKLRETTELGMLPLFRNQQPPPLPDWKTITKSAL
ncbi:MAG: hypothetical protein JW863_04145 [Chitinispirillaceae bacterium]|nr:hypothetical protein [Chitinispirillaceae bacterium]